MAIQRVLAALPTAFSLAFLVACATPGPVLTASVGTVRTGLSLTSEQAATAFTTTNATARDLDLQRALANPAPNLREEDFPLALAPADIAKWTNAFTALDTYLASVQSLVDPARATATADRLDGLAAQLREGPVHLSLPAEASGAFATFAGVLVQLRSEHEATAIMRRVDPAFSAVMGGLADAIGADDRSGLRGTTRIYWAEKLSALRVAYAQLSPTSPSRQATMLSFVAAMDSRDAQLQNLAQLRASVLALGEAHSAAARGSGGDALFWIGRISNWLDEMKQRTAAAAAAPQGQGQGQGTQQ
jgi:hypothetical protein